MWKYTFKLDCWVKLEILDLKVCLEKCESEARIQMYLWQLSVTGLETSWFSTSTLMRRCTKKEYVLSVIAVKAFPTALGLSQENKAYTATKQRIQSG